MKSSSGASSNRRSSDEFRICRSGLDHLELRFFGLKNLDLKFPGLKDNLGAAQEVGTRIGVHKTQMKRSPGDRAKRQAEWTLGFNRDKTTSDPFAWVKSESGPIDLIEARFLEFLGRSQLEETKIGFSGPPTITRVDLATDVEFDAPEHAQDVLRAFAAVLVREHKISVVHAKASRAIETVSWLGSRNRVQLRIYDKTAQEAAQRRRKPDPRKRVLRIERQLRPKPADPWTVERLAAEDLSKQATGPLRIPPEHSLVATGLRDADVAFRERTPGRRSDLAERLMGTAVRAHTIGPEGWEEGQTRGNRYRDLESYGVWLDPDAQRSVDLGKILAAVQAEWEKFGRSAET